MIRFDRIITDGDGCIYTSGSGYLSFDQLKVLDNDYREIFKDTTNTFERQRKEETEDRIRGLIRVICAYGVTYDDYVRSSQKVVRSSKVDKNLEKFLRLVNPPKMTVFTLSATDPMLLYVRKKIQPIIPDTQIEVGGTEVEFEAERPNKITYNIRKMWGPYKRAEKAKELSENEKTLIIGNDESDKLMMKYGTLSFFLTEGEEKREGNIIYTNLRKMPKHIRQL